MMARDYSRFKDLKSNEESFFSLDDAEIHETEQPYYPVSMNMINKLKDSTKKLVYLVEEIQAKTSKTDCEFSNGSESVKPSVSVDVDMAEIQDLIKLEKHSKRIEECLNGEDNDCSVYKKLTRKCTCLNHKLYNDFTIHFNEDTKNYTSRVGEIIKNLRIVKKFLYMGSFYTINALTFLKEGMCKSMFTERVEIIQGCAHADICNVFEDISIIIYCFSWPFQTEDEEEILPQAIIIEILNKMARIEEGRRYLTFNSKISNDIRKVIRKGKNKLDNSVIEGLETTLNLLLPPLHSGTNLYYNNPLNEGLLNKAVSALEHRDLLTRDELFFYLSLFKNISSQENGRAEMRLNLQKVLNLLKGILVEYDNSEMNIIVTFILNNIMTKEKRDKTDNGETLTFVANVETETIQHKNEYCQIPIRKHKKKVKCKSLILKPDRFINASRIRDTDWESSRIINRSTKFSKINFSAKGLGDSIIVVPMNI